jgi:hypothetical protein
LQGTYPRCPYFSSVSGSSLHEWLHAAAKTLPSVAHSDPRSGAVCATAGVNPDHYRVWAHEGREATAPATAGSTVAVTSWAVYKRISDSRKRGSGPDSAMCFWRVCPVMGDVRQSLAS